MSSLTSAPWQQGVLTNYQSWDLVMKSTGLEVKTLIKTAARIDSLVNNSYVLPSVKFEISFSNIPAYTWVQS